MTDKPVPMPEETLLALRGSIQKWEAIVEGTGNDEGQTNCPLCVLFIDNYCIGCPVRNRTKRSCCNGSPYEFWADNWEETRINTVWNINNVPIDERSRFQRLAQDELDFLTSLLSEKDD